MDIRGQGTVYRVIAKRPLGGGSSERYQAMQELLRGRGRFTRGANSVEFTYA